MTTRKIALSWPDGKCPCRNSSTAGTGTLHYAELLRVIADPNHEEHESTLQWVGDSFDPEAFDPAAVKFDDPKKRWSKAFERGRE